MEIDLSGSNAVVTGGAMGIGRAIVDRLSALGCTVSVWDIAPREGDGLRVDVADEAAVDRAMGATLAQLGHVDILVNNAGVNGPTVPTWDYPLAAWQRVLDIDLAGTFLCARAVAPHMRGRGAGRIVNIASVAGKEGNPHASAYSAAKAGVIGFTKALAKELVGDGVSVNCVAPAMTETELLREMTPQYIARVGAMIPMGRLCKAEEIAATVAWIASPECSFTTGAVFDVSGGRATY